MILMVSIALESLWKDLLIYTSHILGQLVLAELLSKSVDNHHSTTYLIANISGTAMIDAGPFYTTQNKPRTTLSVMTWQIG